MRPAAYLIQRVVAAGAVLLAGMAFNCPATAAQEAPANPNALSPAQSQPAGSPQPAGILLGRTFAPCATGRPNQYRIVYVPRHRRWYVFWVRKPKPWQRLVRTELVYQYSDDLLHWSRPAPLHETNPAIPTLDVMLADDDKIAAVATTRGEFGYDLIVTLWRVTETGPLTLIRDGSVYKAVPRGRQNRLMPASCNQASLDRDRQGRLWCAARGHLPRRPGRMPTFQAFAFVAPNIGSLSIWNGPDLLLDGASVRKGRTFRRPEPGEPPNIAPRIMCLPDRTVAVLVYLKDRLQPEKSRLLLQINRAGKWLRAVRVDDPPIWPDDSMAPSRWPVAWYDRSGTIHIIYAAQSKSGHAELIYKYLKPPYDRAATGAGLNVAGEVQSIVLQTAPDSAGTLPYSLLCAVATSGPEKPERSQLVAFGLKRNAAEWQKLRTLQTPGWLSYLTTSRRTGSEPFVVMGLLEPQNTAAGLEVRLYKLWP